MRCEDVVTKIVEQLLAEIELDAISPAEPAAIMEKG